MKPNPRVHSIAQAPRDGEDGSVEAQGERPPTHPLDWALALAEARHGDLSFIVALVRDFALTPEELASLADLIEHDLMPRPRKGRKRALSPWDLEHLPFVFERLTTASPGHRAMSRDAAESELASIFGCKEETIRTALKARKTYERPGKKGPA